MFNVKIIISIFSLLLFTNFQTIEVSDVTNIKHNIKHSYTKYEISEIDIQCKLESNEKLNKEEQKHFKILVLNLIKHKCDSLGFDYNIAVRLVKRESQFNYRAMSRTGAEGLMQFTEITLEDYPHNVYNYKETIHNGILYLTRLRNLFIKRGLSRQTSNILAVASYNCGYSRVVSDNLFITKPETREYVRIIFNENVLNKFTRK